MKVGEKYSEILEELVRSVRAMGPYREDVVITGGLVPLLYRFDDTYTQPRQAPLLTGDLDFTVPNSVPLRGDRRLRDCLEEGGFVVVASRTGGRNRPPKHYFQSSERGSQKLADVHGEFLVPLVGSRTDRDGNPKSPQQFQDGLTAEALRYLDLLLWQPRKFDLQKIEVLDVSSVLTVQLPRLGAYVVQKALCSERRDEADKRDKDLAYIYDIATLSHGRWEEIRDEIEELRSTKSEWEWWIDKAGEILDDAFRAESGAGPEVVARVYEKGTTSVNPESVDRILSRFLREVDL